MPEIEQQLPTGSDVSCEHLVELVLHLRPLLPGCEWLEEGTLEFLGNFPIDAGDFVNTLVGVRGNRRFAVKHYRLHSSSSYFPTFIRFCNEAIACNWFRNNSFVPFIGVYSSPSLPLCLVFEFMDNINVREYILKNEHVGRRKLLLEIARALKYLHDRDVVHKNLKPTNILVDARGNARLGGLATTFLPPGTPGIDIDKFFHGAAPELVENQHLGLPDTGATKATDVYAFGVLAWEMFAGEIPFSNMSKVAGVVSMWKGCRPARPRHPELSSRLWEMIEQSWRADPAQRITISQAVVVLEM